MMDKKELEKKKRAENKEFQKEIKRKDWFFTNFVFSIALILPAAFWLWPYIPENLLPSNNLLVGISFGISIIFASMKFWKIMKEIYMDSNNIGQASSSTSLKKHTDNQIPLKSSKMESKPITKMAKNLDEYEPGKLFSKEGLKNHSMPRSATRTMSKPLSRR